MTDKIQADFEEWLLASGRHHLLKDLISMSDLEISDKTILWAGFRSGWDAAVRRVKEAIE